MTRTRWVAGGVAVVAVVATVVAGVQAGGGGADGGDGSSTMTGGQVGADEASGTSALAAGEAPADIADAVTSSASRGAGTVELAIEQAAEIRTGSVALSTPDVGKARDTISVLLSSLGGYLASENTQADADGKIRSASLVLKVPSDSFDTAMQRLSEVGEERSRTQSAKDVTREVADVDSRVASARAALERIRLLLDRANSLGTVIRLESVLSDRQAELESLLAQQKALAAQTQMATIDVSLTVPRTATQEPPKDDERGFLTGLSKGWDAFTTMVLALATVAGALLPFAVLLMLIGVPSWLVVRRLRMQQHPDPAQTG